MRSILILAALSLVACGNRETRDTPPPPTACDDLELSLTHGTLNGLGPSASADQLEARMPCSTGRGTNQCGNYVAFFNHRFNVRTDLEVIQVSRGFEGRIDIPVLGQDVGALIDDHFGKPRRIISTKTGAGYAFERNWGTLILRVEDGSTVDSIEFHKKGIRYAEVCE